MSDTFYRPSKVYDELAPVYDRRYAGCEGLFQKRLMEGPIKGMLNITGGNTLDAGTGTGRLAGLFAPDSERFVGVDVSKKCLEVARSKFKASNTSFLVMDSIRLGFMPEVFDTVLSCGMFDGIRDLDPYIGEIGRVLKKGGNFIFTAFNKKPFFGFPPRRCSLYEFFNFDIRELRRELQNKGFLLRDVRSTFFIPLQVTWGVYRVLYFKPLRGGWLYLVTWIESLFLRIPALKAKGNEFIILAQKVR